MNCNQCAGNIEEERLEALPTTKICIKCARKSNNNKPVRGVMCFDGKTGGTIQIITPEQFTDFRYYAPYGRNTGRGSGIHRVTKTTSSM